MHRTSAEWNHNTYHHARLLRLLRDRPGVTLEIGCGDGSFAALLGARSTHVLALDTDAAQVAIARERTGHQPNVEVRQANFLSAALPSNHFDAVTALASFHHMPFAEAAAEARRVLKPGGLLLVLGVWTDRKTMTDFVWNVTSTGLNLVLRRRHGPDVMAAPATLPTMSLPEIRGAAARHLPKARVDRHLLWRYTLSWIKPPRR